MAPDPAPNKVRPPDQGDVLVGAGFAKAATGLSYKGLRDAALSGRVAALPPRTDNNPGGWWQYGYSDVQRECARLGRVCPPPPGTVDPQAAMYEQRISDLERTADLASAEATLARLDALMERNTWLTQEVARLQSEVARRDAMIAAFFNTPATQGGGG